MKTYDQLLTETTTTKAISIAARLKGGINRLKAKMPGTQANKIQKINKRTDPNTYHESELEEDHSLKGDWKKIARDTRSNQLLSKMKDSRGQYTQDQIKNKRKRSIEAKIGKITVKKYGLDEGRAKLGAGAKAGNRLLDGPNRKTKKAYKQGNIAKANHNFDNSLDRKDARTPIKNDRTLTNHIKRANANSVAVNNWKRKLKEDELGPNAVAVQKTRKSLGIKEAIKTLGSGSITRSASGKTLTMKTTDSSGKVSTKKKSIKELDYEDDIEYAIRSKTPAKPVKEAEAAAPKPEPKKVNRLKYFLDRAKKKETVGESED
jgi:hypothetical protein